MFLRSMHDCSSQVTYVCWFLVLSCYGDFAESSQSSTVLSTKKNCAKPLNYLR